MSSDHGGGLKRSVNILIDHHRADLDLCTLDSALVNLSILLVEERDEFGAVMAAIALGSEDESRI